MGGNPLVSIIIPTYNSAGTLRRTLDSIAGQTYDNIEVIVVDKGSSDSTVEIAESFGARVLLVRVRERSEQKNLGAREARGDYLYFVDSDFILEPRVVEEAVSKCELEGYDAVLIHNTSDPTISFWARVRKFERDFYIGDRLNVAVRFMRREVFFSVGGFDESLVAGEDYDLHNRIVEAGYRIGEILSREVHIGEPRTLLDVAKKHFYYGRTIGRFIAKNGRRGVAQISPVRPSYLRNWRRFLEDPVITIGFVVYQTVRYASAAAGLLGGRIEAGARRLRRANANR